MGLRGDAVAVSFGGACRVIEFPQVEDSPEPVVNIVPLQGVGVAGTLWDICSSVNTDQLPLLAQSTYP